LQQRRHRLTAIAQKTTKPKTASAIRPPTIRINSAEAIQRAPTLDTPRTREALSSSIESS